jgi:hypothetical protein
MIFISKNMNNFKEDQRIENRFQIIRNYSKSSGISTDLIKFFQYPDIFFFYDIIVIFIA